LVEDISLGDDNVDLADLGVASSSCLTGDADNHSRGEDGQHKADRYQ
jgi:hypothetical protein